MSNSKVAFPAQTAELVHQLAFAKGQRLQIQSRICKRSAEMICAAILGKSEEVQKIKEAMDNMMELIEDLNTFVADAEKELVSRKEDEELDKRLG